MCPNLTCKSRKKTLNKHFIVSKPFQKPNKLSGINFILFNVRLLSYIFDYLSNNKKQSNESVVVQQAVDEAGIKIIGVKE